MLGFIQFNSIGMQFDRPSVFLLILLFICLKFKLFDCKIKIKSLCSVLVLLFLPIEICCVSHICFFFLFLNYLCKFCLYPDYQSAKITYTIYSVNYRTEQTDLLYFWRADVFNPGEEKRKREVTFWAKKV